MAPDTAEQTPLLPKSTLRRTVSRRSLAISRRPTIYHLRGKLQRARTLATKLVLRRSSAAPTVIDYFTTRLPAEIRLKIYGYILHFDAPLKLDPNTRRSARPRDLDILRVCRLIHAESVPALYEFNTVSTERAAFCTNVKNAAKLASHASLNHDMVRTLYISSLAPSPACEALQAKLSWLAPARNLTCVYCDQCLLPTIRSLRDMPRLRKAMIDYHTQPSSISKLYTSLAGAYGRATDLQLACVGVGKYSLTGPWFASATIELRDVLLTEIWTRLLAFPGLNLFNAWRCRRQIRAASKEILATLAPRFGKKLVKDTLSGLLRLFSFHDHGMIPRTLEQIWPADLPMEFKAVEACGPERAEFLHRFNLELQKQCAECAGLGDMVRRRGAQRMSFMLPVAHGDDFEADDS